MLRQLEETQMVSKEDREKVYSDEKMNAGLNTDDAPRNIGLYQCSGVQNMRYGVKGGIYSTKGKVAINDPLSFGSYVTNRGGAYAPTGVLGSELAIVAQESGADTAIFTVNLLSGIVTKLLETIDENSLPIGKRVFFTIADTLVYWKVEGESDIYYWGGNAATPVSKLVSVSGAIPSSTKLIASWKSRLWLGNDSVNPSEITSCAYRTYNYWNTATANSSGDKAYQAIPDSRYDDPLVAFGESTFDTLCMLRTKSVWILIGSDEKDWEIHPLSVVKGCIATRSAASGNQALWFLSEFGIERITGSTRVSDANAYDSLLSTTITADDQDAFDAYSKVEKENAFARSEEHTSELQSQR